MKHPVKTYKVSPASIQKKIDASRTAPALIGGGMTVTEYMARRDETMNRLPAPIARTK